MFFNFGFCFNKISFRKKKNIYQVHKWKMCVIFFWKKIHIYCISFKKFGTIFKSLCNSKNKKLVQLCVFQKIWKILLSVENFSTTSVGFTFAKTNTNSNNFFDLFLSISAVLLTVGFEVAYGGKLLKKLNKEVFV